MLDCRIDQYRRLVVLTCVGEVSATDILALQESLPADPCFDPAYSLLFDGRAANLLEFAGEPVRRLTIEAPFTPPSRRAFVVRHSAEFALLQMHQAYSDLLTGGSQLRVFRDLDAATDWLEGRRKVA
jgi:hypothetical protein